MAVSTRLGFVIDLLPAMMTLILLLLVTYAFNATVAYFTNTNLTLLPCTSVTTRTVIYRDIR
jgi:hypothetical protein